MRKAQVTAKSGQRRGGWRLNGCLSVRAKPLISVSCETNGPQSTWEIEVVIKDKSINPEKEENRPKNQKEGGTSLQCGAQRVCGQQLRLQKRS